MSLVTISNKRNRVYTRKFDHEEARALRVAGESYEAIARQLGVSVSAVARVCDPAVRLRMDRRTKAYLRAKRVQCKGGCGDVVYTTHRDFTGYCRACFIAKRMESEVRSDALHCTKCGEWKPDAEFYAGGPGSRRGKRPHCRRCEAAARRDHRARNSKASHEYDRNRKRQQRKIKGDIRMNQYLVLRQGEGRGSDEWHLIGRCEASTPVQAVERTAQGSGSFVAVAEAHVVDVEPVTVLKATTRKLRVAREAA